MKKSDVQNSADLFLYKARMDFHAAELMYRTMNAGDEDIGPEIILFHLQQSVEKCLKALLSHSAIRFRHTHDLQGLVDLCRNSGIKLPSFIDRLTILTGFAVEGRYSLIHDDIKNCDEFIPLVESLNGFTVDYLK
jgi:HEPN domain-containing protein